jgi:formylglycine-generating enzyme required for sulfatase activity
MPDIEIIRGYEVLPDNNVRFGIRVTNNSDFIISDVEIILDYREDYFKLEGNMVDKIGTIPPTAAHTAKFILKPLSCVHKEEIGATVRYKDHKWNKHMLDMTPKEVHCVCPFLKERSMSRGDFLVLTKSGYSAENGVNFESISVNKVVDFLSQTCKNRLYKIDEFPIENGVILYLAGDAVGEKAYYLLTAVVKEYEDLIQVLLRGNSDKQHGLSGFLNEILENLRHLVLSTEAREIGIVKKEQVINIIDSVVQRTTFSGGEGPSTVNINDSLVQRTEFNAGEDRRVEEERLKKEQREMGEQERARKDKEEKERLDGERQEIKAREESERKKIEEDTRHRKELEKKKAREEREKESLIQLHKEEKVSIAKQRPKSKKNVYILAFVLGALVLGLFVLPPGSNDTNDIPPPSNQNTYTNSIGVEFVLIPAGEFDMGLPSSESYHAYEEPIHTVNIENTFYLGKHEVTQKQWYEIMGTNPSNFKGGDLPVENVLWDDVQEFIRILNEKEGTDKYRLPSEAEWEYAAHAGTTTRFSSVDSITWLGEYAWYGDNSGNKTHPVGQKKQNPWGLYDINGNVFEWVQDKWHDNYVGAPTDGSAWESESNSYRVVRGGGWKGDYRYCRLAYRQSVPLDFHNNLVGFRLLKEA